MPEAISANDTDLQNNFSPQEIINYDNSRQEYPTALMYIGNGAYRSITLKEEIDLQNNFSAKEIFTTQLLDKSTGNLKFLAENIGNGALIISSEAHISPSIIQSIIQDIASHSSDGAVGFTMGNVPGADVNNFNYATPRLHLPERKNNFSMSFTFDQVVIYYSMDF